MKDLKSILDMNYKIFLKALKLPKKGQRTIVHITANLPIWQHHSLSRISFVCNCLLKMKRQSSYLPSYNPE